MNSQTQFSDLRQMCINMLQTIENIENNNNYNINTPNNFQSFSKIPPPLPPQILNDMYFGNVFDNLPRDCTNNQTNKFIKKCADNYFSNNNLNSQCFSHFTKEQRHLIHKALNENGYKTWSVNSDVSFSEKISFYTKNVTFVLISTN